MRRIKFTRLAKAIRPNLMDRWVAVPDIKATINYTLCMERIFIIDDDSVTLIGLRACLSKSGYQVDTFTAIEQIPNPWPIGQWDCIICDYFIYDRTGQEVLKIIRDSGDDTAFVFLTANEDLRTVIDAMQAGATDYFLKPFEPRALIHCVARNIRVAKEHHVLEEMKKDKTALEMEKHQIINWRLMYAAKETRQTEMMIRQLSRSINRTGGFGWVDLIEDDAIKLPEGRVSLSQEILSLVMDITNEQRRILEYLDFMSKIDSTRFECIDINTDEFFSFVEEILTSGLLTLASRNKKTLKLSLPTSIRSGTISIEKTYFRSILWELIANALKYSPDNSDITIYPLWDRAKDNDKLQLVVANEAIATPLRGEKGEILYGIPYEYCEQVFDMFYSLDPAGHIIDGEEWQDGTGLYIARKLMKRMGGWLKAGNGSDLSGPNPRLMVNLTVEFPLINNRPTLID